MIDLNKLTIENINSIDFDSTIDNVVDYKEYYAEPAGQNHYRLLAYISSILPSGSLVYDIGTKFGTSAYALSFNKDVNVVSYDINSSQVSLKNIPKNISFKIGDFRQDDNLLKADVIFIDIDPHNGTDEYGFYNWFIEKGYKGLTLWDDTHHPFAMTGMKTEFLDKISHPIVNLTPVGHISGTTAIVF